MQRRRLLFLLSLPWVLSGLAAWAAGDPLRVEDPLRSIRQLSDEVYRISQEMVEHGADGHTDEIGLYAGKMTAKTESLIQAIESSADPKLKPLKKKILVPLKNALKKAKEAARLSGQNKALPALDAARKASFQAKRSRQEIQKIQ